MKKIISIALAAVLALALLAGCGSSAAPATTTALAPEAPAELSGTAAPDGSTPLEAVIGAPGAAARGGAAGGAERHHGDVMREGSSRALASLGLLAGGVGLEFGFRLRAVWWSSGGL